MDFIYGAIQITETYGAVYGIEMAKIYEHTI